MTAGDLHDVLAQRGAQLMSTAMSALEQGTLPLQPQPSDGVTYAAKIEKDETRIDWTRPAREVLRHIHGLSPFPGAWTEFSVDGQPQPDQDLALQAGRRQRRSRAPCSTTGSRSPVATALFASSSCSAPASSRCHQRHFCAARR